MKHGFPKVIQKLNSDLRDSVEKCYMAGELSKREFKQKCKSCNDVDCGAVMKLVSQRVSALHPRPDGAFSWILAKRLVLGVLRILSYILDEAIAKTDRMLKSLQPADLRILRDLNDLPPVPEELPEITEVVMDIEKLPHIAKTDIFQLMEFDRSSFPRLSEEDDPSNFGSWTEAEALHFATGDWREDFEAQEQRLAQQLTKPCPTPDRLGTPKRKAPAPGSGDSPPCMTPSKRLRRNLEEQYPVPEFVRPEESGVPSRPEETESPGPEPVGGIMDAERGQEQIMLTSHSRSNGIIPPVDVPLADIPQPVTSKSPESQEPSPELSQQARIRRPLKLQIPPSTLDRRIADIFVDTVTMEQLEVDPKKIQNDAAVLFKNPCTTWTNDGNFFGAREHRALFEGLLKVVPQEESDFDRSLYLAEESIHNIIHESRIERPEGDSHDPLPSVPDDSHREQAPIEVLEVSEQAVLEPMDTNEAEMNEPAIPEIPSPPAPANNDVPLPEGMPDAGIEFRASQSRSFGGTTRSITTSEEYCPMGGMTNGEFLTALRAKWQEKKSLHNLKTIPSVDFDEVVRPSRPRRRSYVLGLVYAMEASRDNEIHMRQARPYSTIWLSPAAA